ncbi:MAG: FAD-dependent oxidoreductase [Acidimicrobiales bacterium]|nr:FAD-dependent oxidoreductase [Acidimicrobiales bacterium]
MQEEAQVVIIGAGAMGAGLFYYLAHEGWTDTLLIEKGELSSGSTWHAAGLIPHFIGSLNMAKNHKVAADLYPALEAETGMNGGWHQTGAIRLALDQDQVDWFKYVHGIMELVDNESYLLEPKQILEHWPFMDVSDVLMGFHTPNDGWADPSMSSAAMVAGGRQLGAKVHKHTLVTETNQLPDGRWEVITDKGRVVCEHLVNAAGCYAPQVGAMAGIDVPIVSVIHQYLITEPMKEITDLGNFQPPIVRDPRASAYYRREIDSLLVGPYERENAQVYGIDGIDWDKHFYLTPPDLDQLMPWLIEAGNRVPAFQEAGIKTVISGPITHTPDSGFLMGPATGHNNYWHCSGASIGVTQGPGAGKYLAQWMVHGQTEINVAEMDPRRFGDHCGPKGRYAKDKAIDEFHEMYATRLPGEQRFAGRPQKADTIYDRLDAKGAQWQEIFGWERPQYFGDPEAHSFRRSNAFDAVAAEVNGTREIAGIADLSAFAKFEVTGSDAGSFLERMAANKMPVKPGGMRLTHFLTTRGGIEAEMTVTKLADDRYYLNSGITSEFHDRDWLVHHIAAGEDVTVTDVTEDNGILAVAGPKSRDILSNLTDVDLTNESFRWLTGQEIVVAELPVTALRVSYVGELGWELHCPMEQLPQLYDAIVAVGEPLGMVHYGAYAMNCMRIEKAYKAMGSELTTEITPVEADLGRFVNYDLDFQGKAASQERLAMGDDIEMILVYCSVDTADNDPRGNEPVYCEGELVGLTTSGTFGHSVGMSLAFAYVDPKCKAPGTDLEIKMMNEMRAAKVLADAAYDAANEKPRG